MKITSCMTLISILYGFLFGISSTQDQRRYKARTIGFSAPALDPQNNMDPRATYKYVDIVEIPTDEIINDEDNITAIVNDANWPQPIPVNGPNSNLNTGGLLSTITNKWLEDKMSAYTKDFGTFIGRFRPRAHGIAGLVYAVDDQNLFIRNFWYDGTGPDAYFWVGNTRIPTPKGWVVPYPPVDLYSDLQPVKPESNGGMEVSSLKKMKNKDVLLTLPGTLKVRDINWLSIWCKRFTVNYGEVYIPKDLDIPEKVTLSSFTADSLGKLSSGPITILDSTSFYIRNLQLLVVDPGYHFWVGNSTNMTPDRYGTMVTNEKARYDDLKIYNGNDIIITLPKGMSMFDVNYLSIYNDKTDDNLGHIQFDIRSNKIPPALGQTKKPGWWFEIPTTSPPTNLTPPPARSGGGEEKPEFVPFNHTLKLPNCRELLGRKVRLLWAKGNAEVYFRLKVHMDISQFAAVGIASEGSPMIDADFVRVFYNKTSNQFATEDAFLSKQLNCDFVTGGLCSDEKHNFKDHVNFMGTMKNHGLAVIDFKRSIMPHDSVDAPIPMEGPCQVIVAIGRQQNTMESYSVNTPLTLETENVTIDFSSTDNFCPDANTNFPDNEAKKDEGWKRNYIKDKNLFVAQFGPSGGYKGYGTVTGELPSEKSVCWWINGMLLPEIYVYRGRTYFFRVQGGDGYQHAALNNPLYITDHRDGGYGSKTDYEKERETIYAGVEHGQPVGVGPLCEYVSVDGADKADQSASFEEYKQSLQLACEQNRAHEYGWVNWTVTTETPDVVYYQSFYGYGLGWKIHVLDEGEEPSSVQALFKQEHYLLTFMCICFIAYLFPC